MNTEELKPVLEAILMVADQPLSVDRLVKLVPAPDGTGASRDDIRKTLDAIQSDYAERGIELAEVASGYRFRTRAKYAEHIGRMWDDRKPRYSRAFMETLAIIAYRQPITRGEIEHIRGVAVSTNIMRQLLEREWVRVVGHRDVPGRPSVYATTNSFLDYFGLKSLEELPSLAELKDIDDLTADLFAEPSSPMDDDAGEGTAATDEAADDEDPDTVADDPEDALDLEATDELDPNEALAETGDMADLSAAEADVAEAPPAVENSSGAGG